MVLLDENNTFSFVVMKLNTTSYFNGYVYKIMNNSFITTTMLIFPSLAMASGGEVLSLLWLSFLVFVIVVVSLFLSKFTEKQKTVVFFVYLVAALFGFIATSSMPYLKNAYTGDGEHQFWPS